MSSFTFYFERISHYASWTVKEKSIIEQTWCQSYSSFGIEVDSLGEDKSLPNSVRMFVWWCHISRDLRLRKSMRWIFRLHENKCRNDSTGGLNAYPKRSLLLAEARTFRILSLLDLKTFLLPHDNKSATCCSLEAEIELESGCGIRNWKSIVSPSQKPKNKEQAELF